MEGWHAQPFPPRSPSRNHPARTPQPLIPARVGRWSAGHTDTHPPGHQVILVTANARLGVFGFLASDALRSRAANNGTGNYGMLDQVNETNDTRRMARDA